jgi:hypothetical protein
VGGVSATPQAGEESKAILSVTPVTFGWVELRVGWWILLERRVVEACRLELQLLEEVEMQSI